jgi:hypothetical protein
MKAFLVLGPESSGTKFLTELLIAGGCKGDEGHLQPFDHWQFGEEDPIVWRRSFPWTDHHLWPNIALDLLKPLRAHGFNDIIALIVTRDWFSLSQSQVDPRNRHAPDGQSALLNISLAYQEIFTQLATLKLPFLVVAYEALITYQERAVRPLLKKLGLNYQSTLPKIRNDNGKYYP